MAGALEGIRVLDLSWGIAGPMSAMLLADHGAQVTKIEPPGGDPFRAQLGYRVWQRGKKSAVLDLKDPQDLKSFLALAAHADVLVESFSPGVTERLGIDYATLLHHGLRPRQQPLRAPRLRCTGGRTRRTAMGAARLARRRHQSHVGR